MMGRRGWLPGLCVGLVALAGVPEVAEAQPAPTRADDPARVSFEQGMAALQANRPADAVRAFQDSYRRRPVAVVLYNLALAYRAQGRMADAVAAFERFLRSPGDTVDEARLRVIRAEVTAMRAQLAQVELTVWPAEATVIVDGLPVTVEGGTLLLDAGEHVVEFDAPGLPTQRRSGTFARGSRDRWNVVLAPPVAARPAPPVIAARPAAPVPSLVVAPRLDDGRDRQRVGMETPAAAERSTRPGWVVPVVVAASVVVAAGIGVGVWAWLREPGLEVPSTTTGWTVETIRVGDR